MPFTESHNSSALVLHRFGAECRLPSAKWLRENDCLLDSGNFGIPSNELFYFKPKAIFNATLTLIQIGEPVDTLLIEPMRIKTWKIDF